MYKFWTKEDLLFVKETYGKMTAAEVGEIVGHPRQSVTKKISALKYEWTENEIQYLIKNYANTPMMDLEIALDIDSYIIATKATLLDLKRPVMWTKERTQYLLDNYKEKTYAEIGEDIGLTKKNVESKAQNLRITKNNFIPWTNEEEQYLIENYPIKSNMTLAKELDKKKSSIYGRARKLGLRKKYNKNYYKDK